MLRFAFFLLLLGMVIYALMWVIDRRTRAGDERPAPKRPQARPMAPDDDEDWLRDLDRRRREDDSR